EQQYGLALEIILRPGLPVSPFQLEAQVRKKTAYLVQGRIRMGRREREEQGCGQPRHEAEQEMHVGYWDGESCSHDRRDGRPQEQGARQFDYRSLSARPLWRSNASIEGSRPRK